ncbi:hypothetical protein [Cellulomonas sp. SG140]|uniref:hypothetical protein n=1 Tax=Cellulomonas sp. SG140 TaxID=2976536 RepID=UPI0021E90CF0|nr:hypothetical protein [Cellulomonas sp. SG140]
MTTTPVPPAGPALEPSGGTPPRGPVHAALAALVADGTLSPAQGDAVLTAIARSEAAPPGTSPAATPPAAVAAASPAASVAAPVGQPVPAWRGRLLEAGVYLGSVFVLAAVALVVQQSWSTISRSTQLLLAGGLTAVAAVAGLLVGWPVRPQVVGTDPRHAVRRRSASVVLTLAVALAAATAVLLVREARWSGVVAAGVALVLMLAVHLVAPSVVAELAMFGAGAVLLGMVPEAVWPVPQGAGDVYDFARTDLTRGLLLFGYGVVWAWLVSRRLPHRQLGVALGLVAAVIGAPTTAGRGMPVAAALLGVLAVAAVVTYLRDPLWAWMVGAVGAAFLAVVLIGNRTMGPALTFLVAGLVLLGGTAAAVVVGRRRAARAGDRGST